MTQYMYFIASFLAVRVLQKKKKPRLQRLGTGDTGEQC